MATKYCREDGTASWANAVGPESSASDCCTLATAGSNANDDDIVYVSGLGGVYRSSLSVSGSGTAGHPITFIGSNSPIINGADIVTGWDVSDGSLYEATCNFEPQQVFIDAEYGDRKTSTGACVNEYDWFWASNVLYLYAPGDPDTEYTLVEASNPNRNPVVTYPGNGVAYVVFDGLHITKADHFGSYVYDGGQVTFQNCIVDWCWQDGLGTNGTTARQGVHFDDNVLRYNGRYGATINGNVQDSSMSRNDVYENGKYQDPNFDYSTFRFSAGMKCWEGASGMENIVIEDNDVYDNGFLGDADAQAVGIWLDGVNMSNDAASPNIIRHNLVRDNVGQGIFIEITNGAHVYSNLVIDNAKQDNTTDTFNSAGIRVDVRDGMQSDDNLIYNNTIVGGYQGIRCLAYNGSSGCSLSGNIFRNNIIVGQTYSAIWANAGGDNTGYGSDNVYNNNACGVERSNFLKWGSSSYSTYDTWISGSSQADNNIETGTLATIFTDSETDDYTLDTDSPCVGEGVDLGADFDDGLLPGSVWPDAVLIGDRGDY